MSICITRMSHPAIWVVHLPFFQPVIGTYCLGVCRPLDVIFTPFEPHRVTNCRSYPDWAKQFPIHSELPKRKIFNDNCGNWPRFDKLSQVVNAAKLSIRTNAFM